MYTTGRSSAPEEEADDEGEGVAVDMMRVVPVPSEHQKGVECIQKLPAAFIRLGYIEGSSV